MLGYVSQKQTNKLRIKKKEEIKKKKKLTSRFFTCSFDRTSSR